jgi:hypothetical protein
MAAVAGRGIAGVRRSARWALVTALAAGACASGARGTTEVDGGPDPVPLAASVPGAAGRVSPNVLSGDELRETRVANLWDALRRLRPQWLRARASTSLISGQGDEPVVYVHNVLHGPLRTLQQMNIDQVRSVEFIDGRDATTRFGTGHGGGVIMVDLDRS